MASHQISFDQILIQAEGELGTAPGSLIVDNGIIAGIEPEADQHKRGGTRLALPPPVNAHDHGRGMRTLAFGARDEALEVWISRLGLEPVTDPYLRAAVAFGRMARSGVAAANHCHNGQSSDIVGETRAVARAARDVGIRIAFAMPISGRNPIAYGDPQPLLEALPPARRKAAELRASTQPSWQDQLAKFDEMVEFEHDLFTLQYGPVGPQWVEEAALEAIAARSAADGRRVHMHLFETQLQREWANAAYPDGLVRRLDEIGLLSPRLTLAHGVWLNQAECELLAERGVTVSVNTSSNLRLRSGIAPVGRFVETGLAFGLGLDGMAFDDDEDVLRELRMLWHLQRGWGVTDALDRARLFKAVFVDGRASILGQDGGGRLQAGAPGDVLVLDMSAMQSDTIIDNIDPVDLLLSRVRQSDVAELYVAGRQVVRDGALVALDLPAAERELLAQARAAAKPFDAETERRASAAYGRYYACGCHTQFAPKTEG